MTLGICNNETVFSKSQLSYVNVVMTALFLCFCRTSYNNGEWYKVAVSRNGVNATLTVAPSGKSWSDPAAEMKSEYIGVTNLPTGITIIFGSSSPERFVSIPT